MQLVGIEKNLLCLKRFEPIKQENETIMDVEIIMKEYATHILPKGKYSQFFASMGI